MTDKPQRPPAAFRLSDPKVVVEDRAAGAPDRPDASTLIQPEPDAFAPAGEATDFAEEAPSPRRGFRWGRLFFGALSGLVVFALGIWITDFVTTLFQRNDVLGWLALVLAGLTALGLLAVIIREITGLMRLARVTRLRERADQAASEDDREAARGAVREVLALYTSIPSTARGRAAVKEHVGEIIDGRDLLRLAERNLMTAIDAEARALVTKAAGRVSVVTAVSPRALIDIGYVLFETVRLVRRIGGLYGGRPSGLALFRLLRLAVEHLAVTGGVAVTDGMIQQLVGQGLAGRLSARLGEGVINGMMTARIGLAAIDVCRPLPWIENKQPKIADVMNVLAAASGEGADKSGRGGKEAKGD